MYFFQIGWSMVYFPLLNRLRQCLPERVKENAVKEEWQAESSTPQKKKKVIISEQEKPANKNIMLEGFKWKYPFNHSFNGNH